MGVGCQELKEGQNSEDGEASRNPEAYATEIFSIRSSCGGTLSFHNSMDCGFCLLLDERDKSILIVFVVIISTCWPYTSKLAATKEVDAFA